MTTTDSVTATAQPTPTTRQPAAVSTGLSVTSLVLSIVAIPTGWFLLAVAGIVLGFVGWNREPAGRSLATWGIALGFVATLGGFLLAVLGLAIAAPFALWGLGVAAWW